MNVSKGIGCTCCVASGGIFTLPCQWARHESLAHYHGTAMTPTVGPARVQTGSHKPSVECDMVCVCVCVVMQGKARKAAMLA